MASPKPQLLVALVTTFSLLSSCSGYSMYSVVDQSPEGLIELSARKEYNIRDHTGNKTVYDVLLMSPLLQENRQEIRISIEWLW